MSKALLIIGAGGHASVLVDILRQQKREIVGIVSPEIELKSKVFDGIEHFKNDDDVLKFDNKSIELVNGIGSLPGSQIRALIYLKFLALGYKFASVIATSATISDFAEIQSGVQVFAGAIIQTGATIGANTIINTGVIIEHGCFIGQNNHIAPGATLSGQVHTNEFIHIGTGATVIQGVNIGNKVVIGAGATITKDVEENTICFPARITKKVVISDES